MFFIRILWFLLCAVLGTLIVLVFWPLGVFIWLLALLAFIPGSRREVIVSEIDQAKHNSAPQSRGSFKHRLAYEYLPLGFMVALLVSIIWFVFFA